MDEGQMENESLHARIQQLELERDKLHKNVEELCMQKAGPEFVSLATKTYFRRTAGLEQEVENLKKEKADCEKENSDIKNQLSEATRIKTYLEQLHGLEVSKNAEAAKQLEYLRDLVATAFSDRDRAVTEAEKAKESEEIVHQKLKDAEMREQELKVGSIEKEEQIMNLQKKLETQEQDIENCRKVIEKFYKIRQDACRGSEDEEIRLANLLDDVSWNDKRAYLYDDPTESWSFNVRKESPSANYVADLLQEVDMLRGSVDDLQKKLQMSDGKGLETEKRLESRISFMEEEKILSDRHIVDRISSLREYHSQQKIHIMKLLDDERSFQQSVVSQIDRKIGKFHRDVQVSEVTTSSMPSFPQVSDFSESLALALEEKVSALILLSQQEERHIWEKNVHAAVHETVDELQRCLKLASAQKVKALMELAELKQQYQQLLEVTVQEMHLADSAERRVDGLGLDGKLTNLFKKTSFGSIGRRWLGTEETTSVPNNLELERILGEKRLNQNVENARLRIEYATLKDSVDNLERLTTDIRKLRLSLIQAKMTRSSKGAYMNPSRQLDETIRKAETLKISLTSALQLSWTEDGDASSSSYVMVNENPKLVDEKVVTISTAGLEMVELLIMAAHIMKEKNSKREPKIKKEQ